MTRRTLERRCRRVARIYPDQARADEVFTTLLESNAGRTAPRPGDVVNVLWHGLRARFASDAPGTSGAFGDAVSVAVVMLAVSYAGLAAMLMAMVRAVPPDEDWSGPTYLWMFRTYEEAYATVPFAIAAVLTATAAAYGREALARAGAVVTLASGALVLLVSRLSGASLSPVDSPVAVCVAVWSVVALALLATRSVTRAARVVPTWWWGITAMLSAVGSYRLTMSSGTTFDWESNVAGVVVPGLAATLFLISVPLARSFPYVFAGAALAAVPAMPWAATFADYSATWNRTPRPVPVALGALAAWLVLLAVALVALRWRRRDAERSP